MDRPPPGSAEPPSTHRRQRWIAEGLETLLEDPDVSFKPFDVLIVGSGYGGAVAAERLSRHSSQNKLSWRIGVLERGKEYLPGSFPSTEAELPGHVRFTTPSGNRARGRLEGLFDLRIGADVSVLVANGLGGGSLINAGVMVPPEPRVFHEAPWPPSRAGFSEFARRADLLRQQMQAQDLSCTTLGRQQTMSKLGGKQVAITVSGDGPSLSTAGVRLNPCVHCGDCATGCNHGAKISLDTNLLAEARGREVEVYCGATVTRIRQDRSAAYGDPRWQVEVWHTDATLRQRMRTSTWLSAHRLVLSAGTLGSTEILMRSQSADLQFSRHLGTRFSANGDMLAVVHDTNAVQQSVADEEVDPLARNVGPTITSMIDLRQAEGVAIQDMAVPAALSRLFGEALATSALLQQLDAGDENLHDPADEGADPCAASEEKAQRSLLVAMMVRDDASGVMFPAADSHDYPVDAGLRIDWPLARDNSNLDHAHRLLARLVRCNGLGDGAENRVLPNPIWRLLPQSVEAMLGARQGPLLTVHPLGGCPMGVDADTGVVDDRGRVFDASAGASAAVHDGLLVLDGAIVPTSLGINPALTIATLADWAIDDLLADSNSGWGGMSRIKARRTLPKWPWPPMRPRYAELGPPVKRRDTRVQVLERLSGLVELSAEAGHPHSYWLELDLVYKERALFPRDRSGKRQGYTLAGHQLEVLPDPELSRLRLFPGKEPPSRFRLREDSEAVFVAPIAEGSMRFLHRARTSYRERRCRAWVAWWCNRGARDTWQALIEFCAALASGAPRDAGALNLGQRWRQSLALASRAGEIRLFDYRLALARPTRATDEFQSLASREDLQFGGFKRLSYQRRSNPFTQLMRLHLDAERCQGFKLGKAREIDLCPAYLAGKGMPMIRVVDQQDQPTALLDVLSFLLFCARVLINIHLWSFRRPDKSSSRTINRLPGSLPYLPVPEIRELLPDGADHGLIRLTHYPRPQARAEGRIALMVHGYSASGTTFAHPTVQPNLASWLYGNGYEPWIVDLRTSCGMPTADQPWTFEDIALVDLPAAIREVCTQTGAPRIHIISHCMGSAMLSMLLQSDHPAAAICASRLRSWTMSQFGPRLVFSPANVLRAYLVSWFRQQLPKFRYELTPGAMVPGVDGGMYDRLVAALPYLNDKDGSEFDRENPSPWTFWRSTPWVGTRHRLDALIGRTFDSRRMSERTLRAIDDFFGPINLATMTQPIYFAQFWQVVADRGREVLAIDAATRLRDVPMLSLHGQTNGLADPETARQLAEWARQFQLNLTVLELPRHGHQDTLIGADCTDVFSRILAFLDAN